MPPKVVVIRSLSFTGTTWINVLLGCHPRAFALGSPDRVLGLYDEGWEDACRVHGPECSFWPAFHEAYDPTGNFYRQLAAFAQRDVIIVNNPVRGGKGEKDLYHPDVILKHVHVVRDGRAVCRSYVRNNPGIDFYHAVKDWFLPSGQAFEFDKQDPDVLCVRYEDLVQDQFAAIQRFGRFLDLDYPDNFYKFWEFDNHVTSGNASVYGMIRRFQDGKPFSGKKKDFYEQAYERLRRNPEKPVYDARWKEDLSRRELFLFDYFCGPINERWRYPRDTFTTGEFRQFSAEMTESPAALPEGAEVRPLFQRRWLKQAEDALRRGVFVSGRWLRWLAVALAAFYGLSVGTAALLGWCLGD